MPILATSGLVFVSFGGVTKVASIAEEVKKPGRNIPLGMVLAWFVVTWVLVVGYYWSLLWAFLDSPPLVQGTFLSSAIGLGMALPAAPGAMGVFEVVARAALEVPFDVAEEPALAVAVGSHVYQYILSNLLGLLGLAQLGLSLKQLRSDAASLEEEEQTLEVSTTQ